MMGKSFNYYEIGIVESLQTEYGYVIQEAESIVNEYREIMELIGGYPMASDYANYFNRAKQSAGQKRLGLSTF